MSQLFISYRQSDSIASVDRIHEKLVAQFGRSAVFRDVHSLKYGQDFRQQIAAILRECNVLLVVIGNEWADAVDRNGQKRLHDPNDLVRIEVETGLSRRDVIVIPVLVENAQMPRVADLPVSLRKLANLNACRVRPEPDFGVDMQRLFKQLRDCDFVPQAPARPALKTRSTASIPEAARSTFSQKLILAVIGPVVGTIALIAGAYILNRIGIDRDGKAIAKEEAKSGHADSGAKPPPVHEQPPSKPQPSEKPGVESKPGAESKPASAGANLPRKRHIDLGKVKVDLYTTALSEDQVQMEFYVRDLAQDSRAFDNWLGNQSAEVFRQSILEVTAPYGSWHLKEKTWPPERKGDHHVFRVVFERGK